MYLMIHILKLSKPIMLYSGEKRKTKNDIMSLSENFMYLTNLNIPKLFIFWNQKSMLVASKYISPKQKEIFKKLSKKIQIVSLTKFQNTISNFNDTIYTLSNYQEIPDNLNISNIKLDSSWLDSWCLSNRQIKNKLEIKNMKKSAELVSQAIVKLWKNIGKFKGKKSIAMVKYLDKNIPLDEVAYPTICSTGNHILDLHYHAYDSPLKKNSLVLLDIGYKSQNYCCDITRCFPISGKFTESQKTIYQIVLACQKYILAQIKPGVSFNNLENQCYLFFFHQLENINLINNSNQIQISDSEKINFIKSNFMYHRLGHSVGLEVHDISNTDILAENMVYAIEPALYFKPELLHHTHNLNININNKELEKYMDIGGIRIEDTVLITKSSHMILNKIKRNKVLDKEISEIENIMSL